MVTTIKSIRVNDRAELAGLSTDTKPTVFPELPDVSLPNGSVFIEMDTSSTYMYNSETKEWVKQG